MAAIATAINSSAIENKRVATFLFHQQMYFPTRQVSLNYINNLCCDIKQYCK
jgi:hypothetical protein